MVMEATGKFHRAADRSLDAGGFAVAVVNPLRSRLFAQAVGAWAKTDGVDCRMLAILGESLEPDGSAPPSELMEGLQELLRRRDAALAARTALLNQLGATTAPPAVIEIKRQLRAAETAIANLGEEIERLIAADPLLARRMAILTSIPGVGIATAIALIVGLSEIGSLSAKEAAMIAGLAPIACDSGDHNGARHIRGGRPHLRRALYMAALSASRRNPALMIFDDRLIASGKKAKVALTAVMRKRPRPRQYARRPKSALGASSCLTPITDAHPSLLRNDTFSREGRRRACLLCNRRQARVMARRGCPSRAYRQCETRFPIHTRAHGR